LRKTNDIYPPGLDFVGISSTKRRGSNTAELGDGWKLFYPRVEPEKFAQTGMEILVRPELASFLDEWIPLVKSKRNGVHVEVVRPLPALDAGIWPKLKWAVPGIRGRNCWTFMS